MTDTPAATDQSSILRTPVLDIVCEWLLYVSAALIVGGLLTPSIHHPGIFGGTDLNMIDMLKSLWEANAWIVVVIVSVFSILFPLAKTLTAAVLFRFGNRASKRAASLMQFLGKWSMLDVMLAAVLIAVTQMTELLHVKPRTGLYIFAAGVILNNIATARLSFTRAS